MPTHAVRYVNAADNPLVMSGRGLWRGYSLNLGALATVYVYDGVDANGQLIAAWATPALSFQNDTSLPGMAGVVVERGLFVAVTGGVGLVIMYVTPETTIAAGVSVADETSFDL